MGVTDKRLWAIMTCRYFMHMLIWLLNGNEDAWWLCEKDLNVICMNKLCKHEIEGSVQLRPRIGLNHENLWSLDDGLLITE